jgi:hypothetical protein
MALIPPLLVTNGGFGVFATENGEQDPVVVKKFAPWQEAPKVLVQ